MMKTLRNFFCCLYLLFVAVASWSGCGPALGPTILLPKLIPKASKGSPSQQPADEVYIYVDRFVDGRSNKAMALRGEEEIYPDGDPVIVVVDGIEKALTAKGFQFSDSAPVILTGEIREWSATIAGGLSKSIESRAAVYVEVLDPANKRVYSGVYQGFSAVQSPNLSETDVREALRGSMTEAIYQITADRQLIRIISAF